MATDKLTKQQADQWYGKVFAGPHLPSAEGTAESTVAALRKAGWTIEPPPEPRYQTVSNRGGAHSAVDTHADGLNIAVFYGNPEWENKQRHPDPEAAAQAEADRLNSGHYGGDA